MTVTLSPAPVPARSADPTEVVLQGLRDAARGLGAKGVPVPPLAGKLLRPLVAWALVPADARSRLDERFWSGALAVQMVHEASLVHDDILDGAAERRGEATLVAARGAGPALVLGDHYLTGAYRAAAATGSADFLDIFIRAVERTVAGEVAQGRSVGRRVPSEEYEAIVRGKSGELFGAATALGGALLGLGHLDERITLGRDLGALYQRVDDLLDYCPAADTGKPPLQDFGQRKWTWILDVAGVGSFDACDGEALLARIFGGRGASSPAREALARLRADGASLAARAARLAPGDALVPEVLDGWIRAAERGVAAQERRVKRARADGAPRRAGAHEEEVSALARALGPRPSWPAYFGRHAGTFRFASRLFPPAAARSVADVYAFCRFTDDLVDDPHDDAGREVLAERLDAWERLVRRALAGERTDVPLLDEGLAETRRAQVDAAYPLALLEGVRTDLDRAEHADMDGLERYAFCVAGSVGGWITQLFGLRDPALLLRAHDLGEAMQLTNIVRDVGEDLDRGRVYVPRTLLEAHGLDVDRLRALKAGDGPVPGAYVALLEDLMARADERYARAWEGIGALPGWYRRPVAVAAEAYRAIHDAVRRNGHDSLRRRASTGLRTKLVRGAHALWRTAWSGG